MPPGGPPPAPNDSVTVGGKRIEFAKFSSHPSGAEYFGPAGQTLLELCQAVQTDLGRWNAVLMLRLVRLRLHKRDIDFNEFQKLSPMFRSVLRVGRLSEVSVQLSVPSIKANPAHIDIDWYGDSPGHWWDSDDFTGREAEVDAARGHLHFLEDSLSLRRSRIDPPGWSWPASAHVGDGWGDLINGTAPPQIPPAVVETHLEWHLGVSDNKFTFDWDKTKFWFKTPWLAPGRVGIN